MIPAWLTDPEADYVLAAYGVAAAGLLGLLLASWRRWRIVRRQWQALQRIEPE